jgi:hypothetical protein
MCLLSLEADDDDDFAARDEAGIMPKLTPCDLCAVDGAVQDNMLQIIAVRGCGEDYKRFQWFLPTTERKHVAKV